MQVDDIKTITVIGTGIMGHGIALCGMMAGYEVWIYDIDQSILDTAVAHIEENIALFKSHGFIDENKSLIGKLHPTLDLEQAVKESYFIIEAVSENLELKQKLFQQIEAFCPKGSIIASNTSSLKLAEIGTLVNNQQRLVITHWFNPPHIVPLVEIVKGPKTSDATMETTYGLLKKIDKLPIKLNFEIPGFLINRIQSAMVREIFDLYEKGVASAADIDLAVKSSIGFRLAGIGPLRTADLGGLDIWYRVCSNLFPQIASSNEPPKVLEELVNQGDLGIKSGKGFFDYEVEFSEKKADEAIQSRDELFLKLLKTLKD